MKDVSIVICGAAGQGVQTVEEFLVGILKMTGFHVFATKEYMSRVRGGMNSTELRISTDRVACYVERIDVLVTFHKDGIKHVKSRISDKTIVIADDADLDETQVKNPKLAFKLPLNQTATKIGDKIYTNVIIVGVVAALFGAELPIAEKYVTQKFGKKGADVVAKNIESYKQGYEMGIKLPGPCQGACTVETNKEVENEILFDGVEAIGLGAISGGCNFIAAYPMSPSTGLLIFLAKHAVEFGIVVDQAEDEISAINKAIGAWYAGARAITSSSGGGFALMVEGLSLAAMIESPLVIHLAQRPAPATGLPTRTGQEDLNLALYAGHGEFPRMIFAPGTIQEAFYLTQKAFDLADKYQIPVFILSDQYFVDSYYNIPNLDFKCNKNLNNIIKTDENYKRYKYTDNGISPRGIPGYGNGLIRVDSDEHDENGQITEDMKETRPKMVDKRLFKKTSALMKDVDEPTLVGTKEYKILVICWGSNYHVVMEALKEIHHPEIAMLHFHLVYPLHPKTHALLTKAKKVLIIENNATGQFARLLKLDANFEIPQNNCFLKYSGEPFSLEEVITFINKHI